MTYSIPYDFDYIYYYVVVIVFVSSGLLPVPPSPYRVFRAGAMEGRSTRVALLKSILIALHAMVINGRLLSTTITVMLRALVITAREFNDWGGGGGEVGEESVSLLLKLELYEERVCA